MARRATIIAAVRCLRFGRPHHAPLERASAVVDPSHPQGTEGRVPRGMVALQQHAVASSSHRRPSKGCA
ncbi:hypothetical protein ACP4OV_014169 [Aristida adscensionis]